ncbi:MAG: metallophosphoesterase [Verrucomicrobiota bacterium]
MRTQCFDLIGDIHGQYNKLVTLLYMLGYMPGPLRREKHGESWQVPLTWKHPQGRKVIFLGDYIDRGPNVREVLLTVRGMVEEGDAFAIMGNHEYNVVCYYTPDGQGGFLRPHTEANRHQNQATRGAFETNELGYGEWPHWLEWMKRLPLFLNLGNLRCVHACWDAPSIRLLEGRSIVDEGFLRASAFSGTPENRAIETVLKGPEIPATDGNLFRDKEGTYRHRIRSRWWGISDGLTIGDIAMPPSSLADAMRVDPLTLSGLPNYGAGESPVFFGHYWLPEDAPKEPLAPNIACLDFSGGLNGPLVAYRWDGERELSAANYVATPASCPTHSAALPAR